MHRDHEEVWNSQSAAAIVAYCEAIAQELGLTLESVQRGYALRHPEDRDEHYYLTVSIVKPFLGDPQFWFTAERVWGYATGVTRADIEHEIRHELEDRLREHVIARQEQSCTHGRS